MLLLYLIQNCNCLTVEMCLSLNTCLTKCQLLERGKSEGLERSKQLKKITFKIKIGKMVENSP